MSANAQFLGSVVEGGSVNSQTRMLVHFGLAFALLTGLFVSSAAAVTSKPDAGTSCVIIDTDWDIDDLMAIPAVVANRDIAAIVVTEGASTPRVGAAAVSTMLSSPRSARTVPVLPGMSSNADVSGFTWITGLRESQARVNGLLVEPISASTSNVRAEKLQSRLTSLTRNCTDIELMIIGPFTSSVTYEPILSGRVSRVVMQGRPLRGDPTTAPGEISFNCLYDLASCRKAFPTLKRINPYWIDAPKEGPVAYAPSTSMVTSLKSTGLPGTTKRALMGNRSTWDPLALTPGSKSLFWDQSAALFLLNDRAFQQVGGHWESKLPLAEFQNRWTSAVNNVGSVSN